MALTGATGQIYGIRALELLAETAFESHLILSDAAKVNIAHETSYSPVEITEKADTVHDVKNIGATIASGSFHTEGMIICPCSMKTLSNIAVGNSGNLITRASDVTLKERRPLILMPREKPFNRIHLDNMLKATDAGAIIYPPFPSFYQLNESADLEEMITRTMARALTYLGADHVIEEWDGIGVDHE